jgi:RHS repeat-associated protein
VGVPPMKVTSDWWAAMTVAFTGQEVAITLGVGTDHGIFDIYVDGSLWESFDGYAAVASERVIHLYLDTGGAHLVDIRNRREHHRSSSGYVLRFKQLVVLNTTYAAQTISYAYDRLSRLLSADYIGVTPTRNYTYMYDLAGNRTQETVTIGGTPTTTTRSYNAMNQISDTGFTYDANGNLAADGTNTYTWDRANRLKSMGGISYAYDGLGSRVSQTVSGIITHYLLDYQPGLVNVLTAITGPNATHYVHGPQGILAYKDNAGSWAWIAQDGLNSVRMELNDVQAVNAMQHYAPYGVPFGTLGSFGPYQFTGEQPDANGLVYLRNRYYSPTLGVFLSLDPLENLNRYQYVGANPVSRVDPSGMIFENPDHWNTCGRSRYRQDCPLQTEDIDRIAHVARGEASGLEGDAFFVAAAAIALVIINNDVRLGRTPYPYEVLTGFTGVYVPEVRGRRENGTTIIIIDRATGERIRDIAQAMGDGLCAMDNPLAAFEGELTDPPYPNYPSQFPELVANWAALDYIARNHTIIREHSFVTDNILPSVNGIVQDPSNVGVKPNEGFPAYAKDEEGNIIEEFKGVVIRGGYKSVIISNDYNPVPLEWKCPVAENAVINEGFNPNLYSPYIPWVHNSSCRPCRRSTWWWQPPSTQQAEEYARIHADLNPQYRSGNEWIIVPEREFQIYRLQIGGWGYVASCE